MKTLFVCHANVGRSQVAMELYRARGGQADSAGTYVNKPGTTLAARPSSVTIRDIMKHDYTIDMSRNRRTQLTKKSTDKYDRLVVITDPKSWPAWLKHDPRLVYWKIPDTKGQDTAATRNIVRAIKSKVDRLPIG